ncbi:MAG: pseudouridine synthase family protein [Acidimicrobiales bacterium]
MNTAWTWAELVARAVHTDDDVIVLDKPPGLAVTGERHGPDVVSLAAEAGVELHPAHRIDKVTSGLCVLATNLTAHGPLTRQFAKRTVDKGYLAVVIGDRPPADSVIDLPVFTASSGRVRIAGDRDAISYDPATRVYSLPPDRVRPGRKVYPSQSRLRVLEVAGSGPALVELNPLTGRRHQLRVHLAWIGWPIVGDPLFASTSRAGDSQRTHLHAHRLTIALPGERRARRFEARPDAGFLTALGHRFAVPEP